MVKLTLELIMQKCKTDNLLKIKKLDVWSNDLEEVSMIKDLPALEICSLSLNHIKSLRFFQHAQNLSELYLRKNQISELQEIKYLQNCQKLKVLWLWDNPIAKHQLYRQYIIKSLPNLVKLDNTPVSVEERIDCQKMQISDADVAGHVGSKSELSDRPRSHNNRRVNSSNSQIKSQNHSVFANQSQQQQNVSYQGSNRNNAASGMAMASERGLSPQMQQHNVSQGYSNVSHSGTNNYRNENILCAVLALLKELDESGLELVKRDINKKLQTKKQ